MAWLAPAKYETASDEVKKIVDSEGVRIDRHDKRSAELLNAVTYDCVERNGWKMDAELQRIVGKRMGDLLEYVISKENGAPICTPYFISCLQAQGIDPDTTEFTEQEKLIIEFGTAVARDFKHVPADLKARLRKAFTDEQLSVITGMAVIMMADNMFEIIVDSAPKSAE